VNGAGLRPLTRSPRTFGPLPWAHLAGPSGGSSAQHLLAGPPATCRSRGRRARGRL